MLLYVKQSGSTGNLGSKLYGRIPKSDSGLHFRYGSRLRFISRRFWPIHEALSENFQFGSGFQRMGEDVGVDIPRSSKPTCGPYRKRTNPTSDRVGIRRIPFKIDRIRSDLCRIPTRNTSERTRSDLTVYGFRIIQNPLRSYHRKSLLALIPFLVSFFI
jgi:hypothetical protein